MQSKPKVLAMTQKFFNLLISDGLSYHICLELVLHNAQNAQNEMTFENTLVNKQNRVDISFWTNQDLALIGSNMPQRVAKVSPL